VTRFSGFWRSEPAEAGYYEPKRSAVGTTATHGGLQRPAVARPRLAGSVPDPPRRGPALFRRLLGVPRRQGGPPRGRRSDPTRPRRGWFVPAPRSGCARTL